MFDLVPCSQPVFVRKLSNCMRLSPPTKEKKKYVYSLQWLMCLTIK